MMHLMDKNIPERENNILNINPLLLLFKKKKKKKHRDCYILLHLHLPARGIAKYATAKPAPKHSAPNKVTATTATGITHLFWDFFPVTVVCLSSSVKSSYTLGASISPDIVIVFDN